jgi:hypothetical protein
MAILEDVMEDDSMVGREKHLFPSSPTTIISVLPKPLIDISSIIQ